MSACAQPKISAPDRLKECLNLERQRTTRLPGYGVPEDPGANLAKSSISRRSKTLTRKAFCEWMASNLSGPRSRRDRDGRAASDQRHDDGRGGRNRRRRSKHVFGFDKGARENAAIVQALLDNLIERRPPPDKTHLFILNGAKALSWAMQNTFGGTAEIQRRLGCDSDGTCRSDFA